MHRYHVSALCLLWVSNKMATGDKQAGRAGKRRTLSVVVRKKCVGNFR
jgi:hypothetical protein